MRPRRELTLARTAYLPRVDALAQINRATRNNVFGLMLPQNVIPSISGPVLGTNNTGTAWGSAVGRFGELGAFRFRSTQSERRYGGGDQGASRGYGEAQPVRSRRRDR